ncbi:MAG TPA: 16S rRNA (uracil(1498)-N(3))-methyltransferase [Steroidobacteraceae bacterium]|nr:16S rRNA (uracil(1498)-N(3))-methyltransferase [Steroidobacteraceae bacterium]
MRLTRVHVEAPLAPDSRLMVAGAAANHIRRVLRLAPGDPLTLFDGRGGEYDARIEGLGKDTVIVAVGSRHPIERESPLAITLAQGVSRGERMDLVVQKATELGVRRIVPVLTERTVVRLGAQPSDPKVRHWRAIAVAACEQCGRNAVPEIASPVSLETFLSGKLLSRGETTAAEDSGATRVVLSPESTLRVRDVPPVSSLIMLVGPEGGLAHAELEAAQAAGYLAVRLGPRILRTETAALAALAAIQERLGDL